MQLEAEHHFSDRQSFMRAVMHLATCHPHRFVVRNDTRVIQGSMLAMQCIQELHRS